MKSTKQVRFVESFIQTKIGSSNREFRSSESSLYWETTVVCTQIHLPAHNENETKMKTLLRRFMWMKNEHNSCSSVTRRNKYDKSMKRLNYNLIVVPMRPFGYIVFLVRSSRAMLIFGQLIGTTVRVSTNRFITLLLATLSSGTHKHSHHPCTGCATTVWCENDPNQSI